MPRKRQTPRQSSGQARTRDSGPVPDAKPATHAADPLLLENAALDEYLTIVRSFGISIPEGCIYNEVEPTIFATVRHYCQTMTKAEWEGLRYVERLPYLRQALAGAERKSDAPPAAPGLAEVGKEPRALALLTEHPDWPDTKIARNVPCARQSLHRFKRYMMARELLKKGRMAMPRGSKSKDGDLEAWDE